MSRIFITGGAGFLGSHLCEYYRNQGWDVVAYDNLTKHELMRTGYDVVGARDYIVKFLLGIGVKLVIADVRDFKVLLEKAEGCDYIVHCAAQPAMTIALEEPSFDAQVNIQGTINVLEVARRLEVPVVNCSTIHIYGNGLNELIKEGEEVFFKPGDYIKEASPVLSGTLTPLHASKRAAEIYTRTYAESYGVKAATFRLTGMYGPRQFGGEDHGWVANFAIRTLLGLPITVYQTDKQVRDIIYVADAVSAFVKFYEAGAPPGIYNICGGEPAAVSLGQVLKMLERITQVKQEVSLAPARQGDLLWFVGDYSKAKERFGWEPQVSTVTGLVDLTDWIKDNIGLFEGGEA